jgi:hypothetical protein
MMPPRSLSWSVPLGNDMKKQLIVVCLVFIFPNKKQLDFLVRSRKIKPRRPASARGWVLVASQGKTIYGELQNKKEQETVQCAMCY